jgi:murein tripeptide amidase MpaA
MDRCSGMWYNQVRGFDTNRTKTLEYITKQLINGYKSGDNLTQTFLNKYDFYIFPIVNPDGEFVPKRRDYV